MMMEYIMGTVNPTPPPVWDELHPFLPPEILTLAAALPKKERELLVYLISFSCANFCNDHHMNTPSAATSGGSKGGATDHPVCFACHFRRYSSNWASGGSKGGATDHPVCFACYCFRCYGSYWAKWHSSPNRQLINEIIDAFEESLSRANWEEKKELDRGSVTVRVRTFVTFLAVRVWSLDWG